MITQHDALVNVTLTLDGSDVEIALPVDVPPGASYDSLATLDQQDSFKNRLIALSNVRANCLSIFIILPSSSVSGRSITWNPELLPSASSSARSTASYGPTATIA
jgi:hypothetical protein